MKCNTPALPMYAGLPQGAAFLVKPARQKVCQGTEGTLRNIQHNIDITLNCPSCSLELAPHLTIDLTGRPMRAHAAMTRTYW